MLNNKMLLILALISFYIYSCKKNKTGPDPVNYTSKLSGTSRWVGTFTYHYHGKSDSAVMLNYEFPIREINDTIIAVDDDKVNVVLNLTSMDKLQMHFEGEVGINNKFIHDTTVYKSITYDKATKKLAYLKTQYLYPDYSETTEVTSR